MIAVTQNVTLREPPAVPLVVIVATPFALVTLVRPDSMNVPEKLPVTVALATGLPQLSLTVTVAWPRLFFPLPAAVTVIASTCVAVAVHDGGGGPPPA